MSFQQLFNQALGTGAVAGYLIKDMPYPTAVRAKQEAKRLKNKADVLGERGAHELQQEALTEAAKQTHVAMINMPKKYSPEEFKAHEVEMNTLLAEERGETILTPRKVATESPAAATDYLARMGQYRTQSQILNARKELLKNRPWLGGEE